MFRCALLPGEWQQALLLLCEMQRARVSLNTWTANEVMASFAKAKTSVNR